MKSDAAEFRNPQLLDRQQSAVLVIDAQERLFTVIRESDRVVRHIEKLVQGATILGVPVFATEQYPERLGATVSSVSRLMSHAAATKLRFSMAQCQEVVQQMRERDVRQVVLVGIETHVCVLQSAIDLLGAGFDVYVAVDAVSTRHLIDHDTALQRMHGAGVTLVTTEMALFEWCEVAGTDEFKAISTLVKNAAPVP